LVYCDFAAVHLLISLPGSDSLRIGLKFYCRCF